MYRLRCCGPRSPPRGYLFRRWLAVAPAELSLATAARVVSPAPACSCLHSCLRDSVSAPTHCAPAAPSLTSPSPSSSSDFFF